MAATKIQPLSTSSHSSSSSDPSASEKQVYTVWMKSLLFNGHGCTIYGSDGRVAYRVDNYARKRSREVYIMDSAGKTLIKILKKNFGVFKTWKGYQYCNDTKLGEEISPWFSVQKSHKILRKKGQCNEAIVTILGSGRTYKIDGCSHKSEYKIIETDGGVVAEIQRKQTASGVALGGDVLTLTVGPTVDHLLIMGLVVVCGLINHCM